MALFGLFASGCAQTAKKGPGAELLYVSNEDSGTLSVIDTSALEVVATIPVGRRPRGVRLSPDGARVFVAMSGSPKCPPSVRDEGARSGWRTRPWRPATPCCVSVLASAM